MLSFAIVLTYIEQLLVFKIIFWPSKIIRTELHKFADKLLGSGDVRSIAQSLYRERRKVYPILP